MKKQKLNTAQLALVAGITAMLIAPIQTQGQTTAKIDATPPAADAASKSPSIYDQIWRYAEWYRSDGNPVIQSFKFTGRFQLDYAHVDADQGDHDEWNIRRFRLGAKATLFKDFTVHAEADLNPQEPRPFYQKLTDCYLAWGRSKELVVTVGKQSAGFTLDGMTSSKELIALDRGNLANNLWFPEEYFPGVSASGRPGRWRYFLGLFTSGSSNPEFGSFDGGVFSLATVGYDFAKELHAKKAELAVNCVYQEKDENNSFTRRLNDVGSVNFNYDKGRWGFRADVSGGLGYLGQSDLWGAMVMPYYHLTDKLQAVARYTYITSDEVNGIRLARYENEVVSGRGDEYNEVYLGLNYYFYGHKLKIQTGVQYAEMRDRANDGGKYSGWAWTTGLRIGW